VATPGGIKPQHSEVPTARMKNTHAAMLHNQSVHPLFAKRSANRKFSFVQTKEDIRCRNSSEGCMCSAREELCRVLERYFVSGRALAHTLRIYNIEEQSGHWQDC
jgi:hypothetical protein